MCLHSDLEDSHRLKDFPTGEALNIAHKRETEQKGFHCETIEILGLRHLQVPT